MRILFFSSIFPHGAARVTGTYNLDLCRALAAEHSVRVVAPRTFMNVWHQRRNGLESRANDNWVTEQFGLPVSYPTTYFVPKLGRRFFGTEMWWSVRRHLRQVLAEFQPDAIVSYWAHPDGEVGLRAARELGIPAVNIVGGSDVLILPKNRARRRCIVRVLTESDGVMSVSEKLRQGAIELGVPSQQIHTIYQGIDGERFYPGDAAIARRQLSLPLDRKILLWVGRMAEVKGLDVLIAAVDELRQRIPNVLLVLVGSGPLRDSVATDVAWRELSEHVRFAGSQLPEALPDWYRAADVTVLSSTSEGLPNVLRESLACGRPFVSTDVGSITEIADSAGGAAWSELVPVGDANAFAAAIERVLQPEYLAAAQAWPRRVWTDTARELVQLLNQLRTETAPKVEQHAAGPNLRIFPSASLCSIQTGS